ncbi:DUF6624 domain-containing protein [Leeuwenhoekiella sp. NPDC079379]|uniref:DUF6624 domain-containing protein n=1 Tax=Leeuwenhoekiella sp. NPDC079379 TaxID=3364122 RepID=UPI0037C64200
MKELSFTLLFFFISFQTVLIGQDNVKSKFTYSNFETEILAYTPPQRKDVSNTDYATGKMVLSQTKIAVKNNIKNFNTADYWNIIYAFRKLNESKSDWILAFKKMSESSKGCEYLNSFKNNAVFYNEIKELYDDYLIKCELKSVEVFNLSHFISQNKYNKNLVELLDLIYKDDQKYRQDTSYNHLAKQQILDSKNLKKIDSLYNSYNKYIGKSLVGEKYSTVMWLVVQHSNIEKMESYLPILDKAVKSKELNSVPLKMLIDRVYTIKYNHQIYGSQSGVELADQKTRTAVMKQYSLE